MKKIITHFSRVFVGILFIISGLIKLNDPIGFAYKLEEYFSAPVLDLPGLIPFALALAVGLVIIEVILGIMLLIGYNAKITIWSLLVMIVLFTFLTFYSAYFNKVTDCGCFGDALKLTPWQSFIKDIVLLLLIIVLFINLHLIKPLFSKRIQYLVLAVSLAGCIFMAYWVLNHLPLKDFRAYSVGTDIKKGMEIPADAEKSVVEMTFIYKVNGQLKEFKEKDLMNLPEGAEFVDRKDVVISQGYVPPIHDFSMELDGSDYKEELLNEPKLVMFVAYDLSKADDEGMVKLERLHKKAKAKGYKVIGLTSSVQEDINNVKKAYGFTFDFYFCDATTLKTIERANPSVVILKNGVITRKVHHNDIEDLQLK